MVPKAMNGTKYTSNYANKITDSWSSIAKTSADLEEAVKHMSYYRYDVPRLNGTEVS